MENFISQIQAFSGFDETMNKENIKEPTFSTPKKRSRSPTVLYDRDSNLQNISNLITTQTVWSPIKKKKNISTPKLKCQVQKKKDETLIQLYSDQISQKKVIELDRPENIENVITKKFNIKVDNNGKKVLEKYESNKSDSITVKILENGFNNVLYVKFLSINAPKDKICKKVVESFTYKEGKENRRVCLFESAGNQSLQEYIDKKGKKNFQLKI